MIAVDDRAIVDASGLRNMIGLYRADDEVTDVGGHARLAVTERDVADTFLDVEVEAAMPGAMILKTRDRQASTCVKSRKKWGERNRAIPNDRGL